MSKLSTTTDKIEIISNKVNYLGSAVAGKYPSAKLVTDTYKNILNLCHPVGSFYETTNANFDPNVTWGSRGEIWELYSSGITYELVSSQVMHPGASGSTGRVNKTILCGAYNTELLAPLYTRFTKTGYHFEFRFTAVVTTNNNNPVHFYLNDVDLGSMTTWSDTAFRRLWTSNFIKLSDVTQTPAAGYTAVGYTLAYSCVTDVAWHTFQFWDLTAQCYKVSDSIVYKWRRIA